MENLGERLPSRELSVLVSTLAIQQRSGGDLVRALSDMAATLEARRETQREVKTLMAGATATLLRGHGASARRRCSWPTSRARARCDKVAVEPARRCSRWASPACSSSPASCSSGRITRIET